MTAWASAKLIVLTTDNKRLAIDTTPTTLPTQAIQAVCDVRGRLGPETDALMSECTRLDPDLSITDARIPTDVDRKLISTPHQDRVDIITVVLHLDGDGTTMNQPFQITTLLWDVLLGFERSSCGNLNLTRRLHLVKKTPAQQSFPDAPSGAKDQEIYMMPIVSTSDHQLLFSSIQSLKTTTLERAGLSPKNNTLHISVHPTAENFLDDCLQDIKRPISGSLVPICSSPTLAVQVLSDISASDASSLPVSASEPAPALMPIQVPEMSSRAGSVHRNSRDGQPGGPSGGAGGGNTPSDGSNPNDGSNSNETRQTPVQNISSAMLEANQEIRQLREQQTQEAMTDRVKRLSKSPDAASDKDRFARSMTTSLDVGVEPEFMPLLPHPPPLQQPRTMPSNPPTKLPPLPPWTLRAIAPTAATSAPAAATLISVSVAPTESTAPSSVAQYGLLARQIAHRVSQQLREAQKRGETSATTYHFLLAQEIIKTQRTRILAISSTESRKNSMDEQEQRII
ncbi:hypothetical protein EDD11_005998 [Mortierella claussenii]|nr:hypothetical protein EDD11_005998 [Mortierella claussenii]